jgi:hypothetical protein
LGTSVDQCIGFSVFGSMKKLNTLSSFGYLTFEKFSYTRASIHLSCALELKEPPNDHMNEKLK